MVSVAVEFSKATPFEEQTRNELTAVYVRI